MAYRLHSFANLMLNLLDKFRYLFSKCTKPTMKISTLLMCFLSLISIIRNYINVHQNYTYQKIALVLVSILFWFEVGYELWRWAMAAKLVPRMLCMLNCWLLGLLFKCSGCDTYSQATPRLLKVSNQKFNHSLNFSQFTWPGRPIKCNRRRCGASRYLLDLLNAITPISEVSSYDYIAIMLT